jgi:hypothetical protein
MKLAPFVKNLITETNVPKIERLVADINAMIAKQYRVALKQNGIS